MNIPSIIFWCSWTYLLVPLIFFGVCSFMFYYHHYIGKRISFWIKSICLFLLIMEVNRRVNSFLFLRLFMLRMRKRFPFSWRCLGEYITCDLQLATCMWHFPAMTPPGYETLRCIFACDLYGQCFINVKILSLPLKILISSVSLWENFNIAVQLKIHLIIFSSSLFI